MLPQKHRNFKRTTLLYLLLVRFVKQQNCVNYSHMLLVVGVHGQLLSAAMTPKTSKLLPLFSKPSDINFAIAQTDRRSCVRRT